MGDPGADRAGEWRLVVTRSHLLAWCTSVSGLYHFLEPATCEQAWCRLAPAGRVQAVAVYSTRERLEKALEEEWGGSG